MSLIIIILANVYRLLLWYYEFNFNVVLDWPADQFIYYRIFYTMLGSGWHTFPLSYTPFYSEFVHIAVGHHLDISRDLEKIKQLNILK